VLANVRTPAMRRGDLAAQRAAVERGASGLRSLARRYGWAALSDAARELLDYAERRTRALLRKMPVTAAATDYLEAMVSSTTISRFACVSPSRTESFTPISRGRGRRRRAT